VTQQASLAGQSTIVDWENGQRIPRIDTVERVAYALGLSPAFLAFGLATEASQPTQGLRSEGIASRLRETRTSRGLSVLALATAAALSHTAVGNVERGTVPTLATAEALAIALGVSPGWLAYGLGPMELPGRRRAAESPAPSPG
jgi:transcriptional regulator with XRE-family HTH domain